MPEIKFLKFELIFKHKFNEIEGEQKKSGQTVLSLEAIS